jgi:hypothetical protein
MKLAELPGERAIIENRIVSTYVQRRYRHFSLLLARSGELGNPAVLALEPVRNALRAAVLVVPASCVLGVLFSPWMLGFSLLPLLFLAAPELKLRDKVAQRREGADSELPFFALLVAVVGGAGVPLYSILEDVAGNETFAWMRREALTVKRDVGIFGMNPNDSLDALAAKHPSKRFADFLRGYTSKVRSGGDVPSYFSAESTSLLRELEDGWERYVARVGVVGSMMITVFGVVPLMLMVVGVFSPGDSVVGLVLFTGAGVPAFTICLVYLAGRMQPTRGQQLHGKATRSALLAFPGAVVGILVGEAWVSAASFIFIFFVVFGLSVRGQMAQDRNVEEGLRRFMKDMVEYKRQEYDLAKAVLVVEATCVYNRQFKEVLSRIAVQLKAGIPLDEVKVECGSKLAKLALLVLGQMSRSGGGSVDTVYQVSNFVDKIEEMRRNARIEMRPYLVLSYISPLLLAFGVAFVGGVLSSFSRKVGPGFSTLHLSGVMVGTIPPALSQTSDLLIVVSAASLGLIGAKLTDFTVRSTLRASMNVALAVTAVGLMGVVGSHSLAHLLIR